MIESPNLEPLECQNCGTIDVPNVVETDNGTTTIYKATCSKCGSYIKFLSKSLFEGVKKPNGKRRKTVWTPSELGIENCEICGRQKDRLGKNEKLESHHKVFIEHGGEDKKDNILVLCTPCHRMAHFLRTYLNDHLLYIFESGAARGQEKQ